MPTNLPTNRTLESSPEEHVSDHNTLHAAVNQLTTQVGNTGPVGDNPDGSKIVAEGSNSVSIWNSTEDPPADFVGLRINPEGTAEVIVGGSDTPPRSVDAIGTRLISELLEFTDWLDAYNQKGFIGETGWHRTNDSAKWNEIGDLFYTVADTKRLWATYWASGELWGANYSLLPYAQTVTNGQGTGPVNQTYAPAAVIEAHPSTPDYLRGVNSATGALGQTAGFSNVDFGIQAYDRLESFQYYASKGHKVVRLAFMWERLQPVFGDPLHPANLALLTQAVNNAGAAGLKVILNAHGFATYYMAGHVAKKLGSDEVPISAFADFWNRMATAFKDNPYVVGYGLMNEPGGMPGQNTLYTERAVINGFDSSMENWTNTTLEGPNANIVWTANQGGSLQLTPATITVGEPDNSVRDRSLNGSTFWADVYIEANAVGNWDVALQSQDASFNFLRPNGYTRLLKGQVNRLVMTLTPSQAQAMRNIQFGIGGFSRNNTDKMYILGIYQGDLTTNRPALTWEAASQAAVTAIRATGDTKNIMVAPYLTFGETQWGQTHARPWITDSRNKIFYEHHQYFDGVGGLYNQPYATNLATAQSQGWDNSGYILRGPQGKVGPTGQPGPTGQGFKFRGEWQPSTSYDAHNVVTHGGSTWETSFTHVSGTTWSEANWNLWALAGQAGQDGEDGASGSDPTAMHGFKVQSIDPVLAAGSGALTAGIAQLMKVLVPVNITVSNLYSVLNTAGAGMTNAFAGIYSSTGTRLGVTADQSTAWSTTGEKTMALTAPVDLTGGPQTYVWVALMVGAATTAPQFAQFTSSSGAANANLSVATSRVGNVGFSYTALPATINTASITRGFGLKFVGMN